MFACGVAMAYSFLLMLTSTSVWLVRNQSLYGDVVAVHRAWPASPQIVVVAFCLYYPDRRFWFARGS